MTESRCLGNARTDRKGKIQVYIAEDMYDALVELQANKNPNKMMEYIKNLKPSDNSRTIQSANEEICALCDGTGKTKKSITVKYS